MKKLLIAGVIASTLTGVAHSAQIEVRRNTGPNQAEASIFISGNIEKGDEQKFARVAMQFNSATIITTGPGGDADEGVAIGRMIRLKNFNTIAVGECFSSCALIWAGGITRFIDTNASVGFHNIYHSNGIPSASGNAMAGAYLHSVGFSPLAVEWATIKPANDISILTPVIATAFGIHAVFPQAPTRPTVAQPATPAPQPTLAKMCYRGSGGVGATARFDQSSPNFPGRQVVIVAEDPNRPSCNARNTGALGRGVIVRVM